VIAHVREHDDALAQRIVDEMFVFENLLDLEDRFIQRLLKDIESDSLIIALKGAPRSCATSSSRTCRSARPKRCARTWNCAAPCACRRSRPNRRRSWQVVRRLADAGEIVISAPGTDDFV
jgi:flagellar motor switch protein FliG